MTKSRKAKKAAKNRDQFNWENDEYEEIIRVSKSEIKRDAQTLKILGEKLVELGKNQLAKIPLNENLRDALELAQQLHKEARRRQLQYIGKLLRNIDVSPIEEALLKLENKHHQQQAMRHNLERWRDKLINEKDPAIEELLKIYPHLDRQFLRNTVRAAEKEKTENKPPKAYREIFRYLNTEILEE